MEYNLFDLIIMFLIKICYLSSILFDAWGDAVFDIKKKRSHSYELFDKVSFCIAILLCWYFSPIVSFFTVISYLPLRMGSFNIIYNLFRGLPHLFVGSTDMWYDRWIMWMKDVIIKKKISLLMIWYIIFIIFGLLPI